MMVSLYVRLIIAGKKSISDVPEKYLEAVKAELIERGYEKE